MPLRRVSQAGDWTLMFGRADGVGKVSSEAVLKRSPKTSSWVDPLPRMLRDGQHAAGRRMCVLDGTQPQYEHSPLASSFSNKTTLRPLRANWQLARRPYPRQSPSHRTSRSPCQPPLPLDLRQMTSLLNCGEIVRPQRGNGSDVGS